MTIHSTAHMAMVDITSVHIDALRVSFDQVRAGDWVFDAWGGRHKLASVRILKDGTLSIKRDDYPHREHFGTDEGVPGHPASIVIVPEHGWDKFGKSGYRKTGEVSDNGFEYGEFYETCRCGETFGSGADGDMSTAIELMNKHADEANGREFYCG